MTSQQEREEFQNTLVEAIGSASTRKDVTKLPEFHGDPSKDNLTASSFIKRVEIAAKAAKWTGEQAVYHMRLALVGKAEQWFEVTADHSEPGWEENFDLVSTAFIVRFEPAAVGTRSIASIREMRQSSSDTVQDFADRLRRLGMQWRRATPLPTSAVSEEQKAFTRLGMRAHGDYILLTLFTLGLKDNIKKTVFKRCPSTFQEALDIALDYEAGMENMKKNGEEPKGSKIAPVFVKRGSNGNNGINGNNDKRTFAKDKDGKPACNYCGIAGHFYKECRKRLREQGNKNGSRKPFKRQGRVAAAQSEENGEDEEEEESEDERVAVIQTRNTLNFLGIA